jgi:deoxyribodipyrimidine photo-lyase
VGCVPSLRISRSNEAPVRGSGEYVLYWMVATRRARWNFAMDRAVEWAAELGKPLLVLEALRCDYPWASERSHRLITDGMRDNAAVLRGSGIGYYAYVEPRSGAGKGLLPTLGRRAAVVVTDEFPSFFLPRMVAAAAAQLDVRLETVDSNGLLPLRATERPFHRAFDFRRFLQRELAAHLLDGPRRSVLQGARPRAFAAPLGTVERRWPRADLGLLAGDGGLRSLPINHAVGTAAEAGGYEAGQRALRRFLDARLPRYGAARDQPADAATSGLSPFLHFGHVSAHQILDAIGARSGWAPHRVGGEAAGANLGWWGLDAATEAFLEQLVTWRELGFNFAFHRPDHAAYGSLPEWARRTLGEHASDPRPRVYDLEEFAAAATHDALWNAAQNQLRGSGRLHNYLRMLWGKKILHWSRSPRAALDIMIELNNRYALDGRDPSSYNGIGWVLGRFDRPWGPERKVFGKVRFMSCRNTRRKLRLGPYLERWGSLASHENQSYIASCQGSKPCRGGGVPA